MASTDLTHDTTQRQHTLASIAQEASTTKRTVQRWLSKHETELGEMQGDTRYFSDIERDILLGYQSKRSVKTEPTEPITATVEPASIEILQGNHTHTLSPIDLTGSRDLGLLRSPYTEIKAFDDPLAMAKEVLNQNQAIIGAMSQDLQQRQQQINQVTQAVELVEQSNENLRQQALNYQIESRVQAVLLNQETTKLQQKITIQQQLGKGPNGAQSPGQ